MVFGLLLLILFLYVNDYMATFFIWIRSDGCLGIVVGCMCCIIVITDISISCIIIIIMSVGIIRISGCNNSNSRVGRWRVY